MSWLGTGAIGKVWQLMDFSTYLAITDDMAFKGKFFAGCDEFETSMWATQDDITRIEKESADEFDEDPLRGVV